jgi:Putative transcription activator
MKMKPKPKITERLRADADVIWKKIVEHPFVNELYAGDLPAKKFRFYVLQDYNYLMAMIRVLSILASKAPEILIGEILEIAHMESTTELDAYEKLLNELDLSLNDAMNVKRMEASSAYANFLIATSSLKSFSEGLTAVLPCFWTYTEIAEAQRAKLKKNVNKIYVEWGSTYLSNDYVSLVDKIKSIVDRSCEQSSYKDLKTTFVTASKYELLFWDGAYKGPTK